MYLCPVHNPFSGEEAWGDNGLTCLQDTHAVVEICDINQSLKKNKKLSSGGGRTLNAPQQICWRLSGSQESRGIQSQLAAASQQQQKKCLCSVLFLHMLMMQDLLMTTESFLQ